MKIVFIRRISQLFFLVLFLGFCVVSTLGTEWWQLRGWPVNWFLELDPLVAIGTLLTTQTLYAGLIWALATVVLTILFGRFFCGWVCPFGTLHQAIGYFWRRTTNFSQRIELNRHRPAQTLKYYVLIFLLSAAAGTTIARLTATVRGQPLIPALIVAACFIMAGLLAVLKVIPKVEKVGATLLALVAAWISHRFFLWSMRRAGNGKLAWGARTIAWSGALLGVLLGAYLWTPALLVGLVVAIATGIVLDYLGVF